MNKSKKIKIIFATLIMLFMTVIGNVSFAESAEDTWDGQTWYWGIAALTTYDSNVNKEIKGRKVSEA